MSFGFTLIYIINFGNLLYLILFYLDISIENFNYNLSISPVFHFLFLLIIFYFQLI